MRISDWSSDVCSSDLSAPRPYNAAARRRRDPPRSPRPPRRKRSSCRLPSLDDPRINPLLEQRQRHRPGAKRNIVEGAQIELVFERFARTRAKLDDLLHTAIIRGGLPREDDIALDLPLLVIDRTRTRLNTSH